MLPEDRLGFRTARLPKTTRRLPSMTTEQEEKFATKFLQGLGRTTIDTYDIIYADPPWDYENWNKKWHQEHAESRWAGRKYPLMPLDDLCAMKVNDIASKNSVLFLWTISTMIPKALKLMEAWGFTYKTVGFVWVKKNKVADSLFWGMGFWTRSNAEICLIGVKGKPLPRISRSVHQIVHSPVRKHSQKPDEVRNRIVELLGDRPRVELFARDRFEGWTAWGNEINSDIILDAKEGE